MRDSKQNRERKRDITSFVVIPGKRNSGREIVGVGGNDLCTMKPIQFYTMILIDDMLDLRSSRIFKYDS